MMCTAVTYTTKDHYFGRTLDLEYSYEETITIVPRNYPFSFRRMGKMAHHYAMIGMAYVVEGYPLFYDAVNEKGLAMAGLHFPDHAVYFPETEGKENIAPFEFIPWLLGQCATVEEVKQRLESICLAEIPFSEALPLAPLHWLIADGQETITVEAVAEGLQVYENPVGVLTNNPPFPYQMYRLRDYLNLTAEVPRNRFSDKVKLHPYSRGMGAIGLPGDPSSTSRFVRAAFTKLNAVSGETEEESVGQFFHILGAVAQQRGCVRMGEGEYEITVYTSCCNLDQGIYYYTTYENQQITAVELYRENLEETGLVSYPLQRRQQIRVENKSKEKME